MNDFVIPPRTGRRHVLHLLDKIFANPRLLRSPETDLNAFLGRALSVIKRRTICFVVSDFVSKPGWERGLFQMSQRHEVIAVRLVDPVDVALPDMGMLLFQDAETGEQLFVDTVDKGFRRRFAAAADRNEERLAEAFTSAGVDVLELSTTDDLVDGVLRFANMRKAQARLGSGGNLPALAGA
jgi:uncharacterized protein (DUF58 family)